MTEDGPLRIGLIGCGKMGRHHLASIRATGLGRVTAVADPAADRTALGSLIDSDVRLFEDPATMLDEMQFDIVHIVTPPSTHAELALAALESGAHVYVEKPFTPTAEEAARVLATADRCRRLVCAGHQVLFEKGAKRAAAVVPLLGSIVHVESYFSFRQVRKNLTPLEQILDILPHAVYPLLAALDPGGTGEAVSMESLSVNTVGEVRAIVRFGSAAGILVVTLSGRPVRHTLEIVGTNGCVAVDFVSGAVTRLPGPGDSAIPAILAPYRTTMQTLAGSTIGFAGMFMNRKIAYKGLPPLFREFYAAIGDQGESPVTPGSILATVGICEQVERELRVQEHRREEEARLHLEVAADRGPEPIHSGVVLVTGGTGFLGRALAQELIGSGFRVRVLCRRMPLWSRRIVSVEYLPCDLGDPIPSSHFEGVRTVLHCAAETAGGEEEHRRNSIGATRNVLEAAAKAGVVNVVQVSSIAVLISSGKYGRPVDEAAPLDPDCSQRGPYVWGKSESEILAGRLGKELGLQVRIVRPGPLVDFDDFSPPGRLGRDAGPRFVAVGSPSSLLPVCGVATMAKVLRIYAEDFDNMPPVLNVLEPEVPSRRDLIDAMRPKRPDLKVWWFPAWLLRLGSPVLKLLQKVLLGSGKPVDIYAAFASEKYDTTLAAKVLGSDSSHDRTSRADA